MENVWFAAALWVGLALVATLLAIWLKISTALTEILVGTVAAFALSLMIGGDVLNPRAHLVATVIGSAVVPTLVANAFFLPQHLLPRDGTAGAAPRPGGVELAPVTTSE